MLFVLFLHLIYNGNRVESLGCPGENTHTIGLTQTTQSPGSQSWPTYQTPTLYQCAELCLSMEICRSLVFLRNVSECRVYPYTQNITLVAGSNNIYVINSTDIPQVLSGPCTSHTCPTGTRCVPRNNGNACVRIDLYCDTPPTIALASIVNLRQEYGATVRYRCTGEGDLYLPQGSPDITCLQDGKWTTTSFYCQEGWKCSRWTTDDYNSMANYSQSVTCEEHGVNPRRWTYGNNARTPGCRSCYCCERI